MVPQLLAKVRSRLGREKQRHSRSDQRTRTKQRQGGEQRFRRGGLSSEEASELLRREAVGQVAKIHRLSPVFGFEVARGFSARRPIVSQSTSVCSARFASAKRSPTFAARERTPTVKPPPSA